MAKEQDKYSIKLEERYTKAREYLKLLLMDAVAVYKATGKTIPKIQKEVKQFLKEDD